MDRKQALLAWTKKVLKDPDCYFKPASNDASFRSYWRVFSQDTTYIIMDAPVEHENCLPFIDISQRLDETGVQVPKVFNQDLEQGFLLLSDLGNVQYLRLLNVDTFQPLYSDALDALHNMQQKTQKHDLPLYDKSTLQLELDLFSVWFVDRHLGIKLSQKQNEIVNNCHRLLIENALEQPQTFVHRDYHSRNLMKTKYNNPGILDFQDAVIGPMTYDLVSLLRDCYISWDNDAIGQLSDGFRQKYNQLNHTNIQSKQWQRWFDLMGIQRHMKAIGIFCRLNYRDEKPNYLKDINRSLSYVKSVGSNYPELNAFLILINHISPTMDSLCEL